MASFAGLISGVLGGAAAGYGESAQMEMKKQADLDLRKQMLEAESEKRLREDETRRERDRAAEDRKLSPEYIAKVNAADLTKATGAIVNRTTLAPLAAGADVAEGTAKAGARTTLAPVEAAAASAVTLAGAQANAAVAPAIAQAFTDQYKASKEFEDLKASDATDLQIKKAKTLAADKDYMDALAKIDLATHANILRAAEIRAAGDRDTSEDRLEAARLKYAGKGPGSTVPTTADLQRQITAAENSLANKLGVKKTDLNEELARLQKRTDAASKSKLDGLTTEMATLDAARKRLLEWSKKPKDAPAPAAPASGARPPLSTFGSK